MRIFENMKKTLIIFISLFFLLFLSSNVIYAVDTDPRPIGQYDATGYWSSCTVSGWACDPSNYNKPIQIDFWSPNASGGNDWVGSAVADKKHSPYDPAVKDACGDTDAHDFSYTPPEDSKFRDGKPHTYNAFGINIDSNGNRVDGNHALLKVIEKKIMTCGTGLVIPDQRFGLGIKCDITHDLNIPWFYDWGLRSCKGKKSLFEVGHVENSQVAISDTQLSNGLKDDDDEDLYYERLDKFLINTFEGKSLTDLKGGIGYNGSCSDNPPPSQTPKPKPCKTNRVRTDFLNIPNWVASSPGSYYQIGNEVDWYPSFTPEQYAEYYDIFYQRIKKYDPSAHIVIGGLYGSINSLVVNEKTRYKWINAFRSAYQNKFGSYPKIDVWAIHPYQPSETNTDWNLTKKIIVDFRDIYLKSIGEEKAKLWINEWGFIPSEGTYVLGSACPKHGCLTPEQQLKEWNIIANDYMKPLVEWMKSNDYVQKWFYPQSGHQYTDSISGKGLDWKGLDWAGTIYKRYDKNNNPIGYNSIGIMYKQLAEEDAEKIPNCFISSGPATVVLGETASYSASFSSKQGKLTAGFSIGQNGNIIEEIKGTYNLHTYSAPGYTATAGSFSWKPKSTGFFDIFCRAWNDSIAECRGNPAYVDKLPRYECAGPKAYMTVKVIPNPSIIKVPLIETVTSVPSCPKKTQGDVDCDGNINGADYSMWLNHQCPGACTNDSLIADFNGDSKVNDNDYAIWFNYRQ